MLHWDIGLELGIHLLSKILDYVTDIKCTVHPLYAQRVHFQTVHHVSQIPKTVERLNVNIKVKVYHSKYSNDSKVLKPRLNPNLKFI